MDRRGQMTLEIVIMLLIVINIYAYISEPLSQVSKAATEGVGVSAMAAKAVDTITNKANLVGVGGDGAQDKIKLNLFNSFEISCAGSTGSTIKISYLAYNNSIATNPTSFGVAPVLSKERFTYSRQADFQVSCNIPRVTTDAERDTLRCLEFFNVDGIVNVKEIPCKNAF